MSLGEPFAAHTSADVVIVGGGVIGLSIARALARRGIRDITVIDKSEFGREASWAAGGTLAPEIETDRLDDFFRLASASRDMYPQFVRELKIESDINVEFDMTGTLFVAFTEEQETELQRRFDWQRHSRLRVEWLTGDEARRLEPCLAENVRCGLSFPDDYQVDNRKLVEALIIANRKLGARLIGGCEVFELQFEGDQVTGVTTSRGPISSSCVVIAAGAWSSLISAKNTPGRIDIEPVRGQMLCFQAPGLARHVLYSSRGYLIPRLDGRLLAGSTTEHVGFDKNVTEAGMTSIKSMAVEIAPALGDLPLIDSWAGFRPRASDGLPILGLLSGSVGLFYATGHYRTGILLAPITAELIAETIVNDTTPLRLRAFSPRRFLDVEESLDMQGLKLSDDPQKL